MCFIKLTNALYSYFAEVLLIKEEGSGWGTRVYLWQIHFDIWQNQHNIVKFKNKIKFFLKNEKKRILYICCKLSAYIQTIWCFSCFIL